jgi:hypothetical protein
MLLQTKYDVRELGLALDSGPPIPLIQSSSYGE